MDVDSATARVSGLRGRDDGSPPTTTGGGRATMSGRRAPEGGAEARLQEVPRILPYLRPYRKFAVISVILTVLLAVLALAEPWPLAFVVDSIIGNKPAPGWVTAIFGTSTGALIALAVAATLFLTLLSGLMTVWNEYLTTTVDQKMVLDLRSEMFDHAQKLSLAFHDTESKGILMYRINNQAAALGQIVVGLPAVAQSLLTVVGMAYISFRINPLLALLALGTTPFVVYSTTYYTRPIEPRIYRVRGLGGDQPGDRLRVDVDDPRRPRLRHAAARVEAVAPAGREVRQRDRRPDRAPDRLSRSRSRDRRGGHGGGDRGRRLPGSTTGRSPPASCS